MSGRIIAIGDVHGCWAELEDMLEYLSPTEEDRLVFLGDIVNRGPDSLRALNIVRALPWEVICLLGNHEWRLMSYHELGDPEILKDYDWETIDTFGEQEWDFLKTMRLWHYVPEHETVLVHGGFLPGVRWNTQTVSVVTRIQVVDDENQPRKRSESPTSPHWSSLWQGPPFVVYGHTPRRQVKKTDWTLGIDTGCVYGGHLSAYILPQKEVVQVKARRTYVLKSF